MKKTLTLLAASFLIALSSILGSSSYVSALSGSDFNPGRIIDDVVFYNSNSMSADQIQAFLNSKVTCDTYGTARAYDWGRGDVTRARLAELIRTTGIPSYNEGKPDTGFHAPPYTCLRDFKQDTPQMEAASGLCAAIPAYASRSSAQIIKDVAVACGINPQVLVVLLEKEQSLVTDIWPLQRQYRSATGFACPDTSPCNPAYNGFFYQVYHAARQFKVYKAEHEDPVRVGPTAAYDYNYRSGQANRVYYQTNLGNFVNPTGNTTDPSRNGQTGCGYTNIYIENQATAALYIYTPYQPNQAALANLRGKGDSCSAYGNRNFWRLFSDWFGSTSTPTLTECDSKVKDVVCVWSVRKDDGSQFLTSSPNELKNSLYSYGWQNEGIVFYALPSQQQGAIPVYRMRQDNKHHYTVDVTEYNNLKNSGSWVDEGVRFYAKPASDNNSSHKVYRLLNTTSNHRYWTADDQRKNHLMTIGYTVEVNAFNSVSGLIAASSAPDNRYNIYRLTNGLSRFYTTNLKEAESAIKQSGYAYESVLSTASTPEQGTPVYRMYGNGEHFYTTSVTERDNAIGKYGYKDEGVRLYVDNNSDTIYRLINLTTGKHLYTASAKEAMSLVNRGWKYETTLAETDPNNLPVYRFVNLSSGVHFYTISVSEAMNITNINWDYEMVAFRASASSGKPVYRMYGNGEHFYTSDKAEHDNAIERYGYKTEGVRFYVSETPTSKPVYRMYGNREHFYTASSSERTNAIDRYGFTDQGERFYLVEDINQ